MKLYLAQLGTSEELLQNRSAVKNDEVTAINQEAQEILNQLEGTVIISREALNP